MKGGRDRVKGQCLEEWMKGTGRQGQYLEVWMGGKWTGSSPGYLGELRPDLTGIRDRRLRGLVGLREFSDLIIDKA